jgi:hypothetical protein
VRRPPERERVGLGCGRRTPQLKRNPLGGHDMLTSRKILLVIVLGCMVLTGGFLYDIMFAGIPLQDPPPELLARYNLHASIAGHLYKGG